MLYSTMLLTCFILGSSGTPLSVDNHACKPELLKKTMRYVCDKDGNITCNNGWKDPDPFNLDELNRCSEPTCDPECENGECRSPNQCACNIGWEGHNCGTCITLPSCVHGKCLSRGLECVCSPGYQGGLCDRPICTNLCLNGQCTGPDKCQCHSGWEGVSCDQCIDLTGCVNGNCSASGTDKPNACDCFDNWEGPLCDKPKCDPSCREGECVVSVNDPSTTMCVCSLGYNGADCGECVKYPDCPGTCKNPNECICDGEESSPLCGIHLI